MLLAQGFSFEAQTDKTEVHFGESLNLLLTVTIPFDGGGTRTISPPQITEIPGFDIVSQRSAQNTTIVNGVGQVQFQTALELVPKAPGDAVIPMLNVKGTDGKTHSTKPIKITVHPPEKKVADEQDSGSGATSAAEDNEDQPKQGVSFFKGILVVILAIALVITAPILLSWFLNRDSKPSTRWAEETASSRYGPQADRSAASVTGGPDSMGKGTSRSTMATAAAPKGRDRQKEDVAVIAPASRPERVNFEREVNSLKKLHPDITTEFYRAYFDLLHRAVLGNSHRLEAAMTPDELFKTLQKSLPSQSHQALRQLNDDWETVMFANSKPGRAFVSIHEDAVAILQLIHIQENRS